MAELGVLFGVLLGSLIVGYLLIRRIPSLLHTPLMSMTNAVSAVTFLGALVILADSRAGTAAVVLGAVALGAALFNIIGGFTITDRMLRMFHKR